METMGEETVFMHSTYRQFRGVRLLIAAVALFSTAPSAFAQPSANSAVEVAAPQPEKPPEGFWPSDRMLKIMLTRWVEESCADYEMDEDQKAKVRDPLIEQWRDFLTQNRNAIQPLANEFIEMRLDLSPPDKEKVKKWAEQAGPLFDRAREQVGKSHDSFREVLRPAQRLEFEADAFQMNIGMQIVEGKLSQWKQGEFDKGDLWDGIPVEREERRKVRRRRMSEQQAVRAELAARSQTDQVAIEMDAWEKYVANFVARFAFDEGQRDAASSFLHELKTRALDHRDRHHEEIDRMERAIRDSKGTPDELAEIKRQLLTLYGPIDDMFKELKERLDKLPTKAQREAVAQDDEKVRGAEPAINPNPPTARPTPPAASPNAPSPATHPR